MAKRSSPSCKPAQPSIKDVATLAGVSIGSVSRVINKFDNVSPVVQQKVLKAIEELGYRSNHAAQTLRSKSSRTVGCMLTDVTNPLYAMLFRRFEEKLREAGYMVLLANSLNNAQWEVDILNNFHSRGMDGVMIAPGNERNPKVLQAIDSLGMPAVILDRDMAVQHDKVLFDHVSGMKAAVMQLLAYGHRDIALVISDIGNRPMRRRAEGFRAGFRACGLEHDPALVVRVPTSTSDAFEPVYELLGRPRRPTAIFSLGTRVLGDVLNAITARGLRMPQDISVVSMGDPTFARRHTPAISTVMADLSMVTGESCRLLLDRMGGTDQAPPQRVIVPTQFIDRGSCGPVPTGPARIRRG